MKSNLTASTSNRMGKFFTIRLQGQVDQMKESTKKFMNPVLLKNFTDIFGCKDDKKLLPAESGRVVFKM